MVVNMVILLRRSLRIRISSVESESRREVPCVQLEFSGDENDLRVGVYHSKMLLSHGISLQTLW